MFGVNSLGAGLVGDLFHQVVEQAGRGLFFGGKTDGQCFPGLPDALKELRSFGSVLDVVIDQSTFGIRNSVQGIEFCQLQDTAFGQVGCDVVREHFADESSTAFAQVSPPPSTS